MEFPSLVCGTWLSRLRLLVEGCVMCMQGKKVHDDGHRQGYGEAALAACDGPLGTDAEWLNMKYEAVYKFSAAYSRCALLTWMFGRGNQPAHPR